MNRQQIGDYRRHLAELHADSSSHNEGVVSQAFAKLLEAGGRKQNLILVQQKEWTGPRGNKLRIDGAMVPTEFQKPFGFWEAKDKHDDIDREIAAKRAAVSRSRTSSTKTRTPLSCARTGAKLSARPWPTTPG